MTRISTIGRARVGNDAALQAEFKRLVDYQAMIYQRLLVLAAMRKRIKAQYPQAMLPFDHVFRAKVATYNALVEDMKKHATNVTTGVLPAFEPLAVQFGPGSAGIGALPVIIVIAIIAAVVGGGAYTITEVQRQNKAAETEIKSLDNMLATFKSLPGADAASLGNFLSKVDYTPGGTPPPATGLTSMVNTLTMAAVGITALIVLPKIFGK